jgi:hypothetical protein
MAAKRPTLPLLLAGLAAYGYYRYSKMSAGEKEKLVGGLKEKGRKFYDEKVPQNIKDLFGEKQPVNGTPQDNMYQPS